MRAQDGVVRVWDSETGHLVEALESHTAAAYAAVWSPHQSLLARCVIRGAQCGGVGGEGCSSEQRHTTDAWSV
jgi:WD40 repeat protein